MSRFNFVERHSQNFSHDFRVSIEGVDVTDLIVGPVSGSYAPDGSFNTVSFSLDNRDDRFLVTRENMRGTFTAHERHKQLLFERKMGRLSDDEIALDAVYGRDTSAQNGVALDDEARNPEDPFGGSRWQMLPHRAVFHRNDRLTIWRKNPLTEEHLSNPSARMWYPAFTGYIESYPWDEDYTGASPQLLSLTGYDSRALLQKLRVATNYFVLHQKTGRLRPTDFLVKEGLFADLLNQTDRTNPIADKKLEDAISLLLTGKPVPVDGRPVSQTQWSGFGRMAFGGVGRWPATDAEATQIEAGSLEGADASIDFDDSLGSESGTISLQRWNDIIHFGAKRQLWTTQEMQEVLDGTYTDGPHDPTDRHVYILLPLGGTILSRYLAEWTFHNSSSHEYQFVSRLDLLTQICDNSLYTWYVTGYGDIVFEFRMWDFNPEDFGDYSSMLKYDGHITSANFSDEEGDYPTAIFVQGSPGEGASFLDVGQTLKDYMYTAVCFSRSISLRVGQEVENLYFPFEKDINRLAALARTHMMIRLSNAHTASFTGDDRPGISLNRPLLLEGRERIGVISSIGWSLSPRDATTINVGMQNIRYGDPTTEGEFRTLLGTTSMPLSYRYQNRTSNREALEVRPSPEEIALAARSSGRGIDSSRADLDEECSDARVALEPDPSSAPADIDPTFWNLFTQLAQLSRERFGLELEVAEGYAGYCKRKNLHVAGLGMPGQTAPKNSDTLLTHLRGIINPILGESQTDLALRAAKTLSAGWTQANTVMAVIGAAWALSQLDTKHYEGTTPYSGLSVTVGDDTGIGVLNLRDSNLGKHMTVSSRQDVSQTLTRIKKFGNLKVAESDTPTEALEKVATMLGRTSADLLSGLTTLFPSTADVWSYTSTTLPNMQEPTTERLADPAYLHSYFSDSASYTRSDGTVRTGRRIDLHMQEAKWELEQVYPSNVFTIQVHETWRTIERQKSLFNSGKSEIDGINKKGYHNYYPSLAYDLSIYIDGAVTYTEVYHDILGSVGEALELEWGGTTNEYYDGFSNSSHFQVPWKPSKSTGTAQDAEYGNNSPSLVDVTSENFENKGSPSEWHRFKPSFALDFKIVRGGKTLDPLTTTNLSYYEQVGELASELGFDEIGVFFSDPLPGHLAHHPTYDTVKDAIDAGLDYWGPDEQCSSCPRTFAGQGSSFNGTIHPDVTVYEPYSSEAIGLMSDAGTAFGVTWGGSNELQELLYKESKGMVGIPNYSMRTAYGDNINRPSNGDKWPAIWADLQAGKTANTLGVRSTATGLGQLNRENVIEHYPDGLSGIGNATSEAYGMVSYVYQRYGDAATAARMHGVKGTYTHAVTGASRTKDFQEGY